MKLPVLITPGDPSGIGPEITLKSWVHGLKNIVVIGNIEHLTDVAKNCSIKVKFSEFDKSAKFLLNPNECKVININWPDKVIAGKPSKKNALTIIESIKNAVNLLKLNKFSGIVTNPISKSVLYSKNFNFPGQTEFLKSLDKTNNISVMMLMNDSLKTVPLTTHIPLSKVEELISAKKIEETLEVIDREMKRYFRIKNPKIAVCGLNPHAGENGNIGKFEIKVLIPVLEKLRFKNLNIFGPFSSDSLFHSDARNKFDVILAMYHDQALIPIKTIGFYESINLTLGLSFIRTSPDHGTAFDIAEKFQARPDSMIEAIKLVEKINKNLI